MDSSRIRCHLWLKATSQGGAYGNFRVPRKPPALARAARWPPSPKAAARALDQLPRTPARRGWERVELGDVPALPTRTSLSPSPSSLHALPAWSTKSAAAGLEPSRPPLGGEEHFHRSSLPCGSAWIGAPHCCALPKKESVRVARTQTRRRHRTSRRDIHCSEGRAYDSSSSRQR